MSVAAAILCILGLFLLLTALASVIPRFNSDSWALAASGLLCSIGWLSAYRETQNRIYFVLANIVMLLLILVYFCRENRAIIDAASWRVMSWLAEKNRAAIIWAAVCGTVMFFVISWVTVLRYLSFYSPNFDFGLFVNMFHNMSETGLPLVTSERDMLLSHFAVHISPIYYLLLPFYMLLPYPITLQMGQAAALALGVIPVYLLCRHYKLGTGATMAVTALYAFLPALNTGCFYDLHENCFLPVLLLFTFYFFEREKYLPMYIFAVLVLCVKEDAAVYLIIFAVYAVISRKKVFHGAALAIASCAYFAFCIYALNAQGQGVMSWRYGNFIFDQSDGLAGAVKTLIVNPGYVLTQALSTSDGTAQKLIYLIMILLPMGLIPFLTKKCSRWILALPILMNILTMYTYQYNINFQYSFGVSAFLIYALIQNLPELDKSYLKKAAAVAAVSCLCMYAAFVVQPASSYAMRYNKNKQNYTKMEETLDLIPSDASLSASSMLVAHVADRDVIYEVESHGVVADVEYVALDMRYDNEQYLNDYLSMGYTVYAGSTQLITVLKAP